MTSAYRGAHKICVRKNGAVTSTGTKAQTAAVAARDEVAVTIPADGAYLSVLRTVTAGLAARLDFTLDDIEDLKIAVDEACAMLLASAVAGSDLDLSFWLDHAAPPALTVRVTVATTDGREPSRDTFSWTVLTALAGEVDAVSESDDRVTISLRKARSAP